MPQEKKTKSPVVTKDRKRVKVNTYVSIEAYEFVKAYAEKNAITYGGAISVIIGEYKKQADTVEVMREMIKAKGTAQAEL